MFAFSLKKVAQAAEITLNLLVIIYFFSTLPPSHSVNKFYVGFQYQIVALLSTSKDPFFKGNKNTLGTIYIKT
jgi:hypothetical protein